MFIEPTVRLRLAPRRTRAVFVHSWAVCFLLTAALVALPGVAQAKDTAKTAHPVLRWANAFLALQLRNGVRQTADLGVGVVPVPWFLGLAQQYATWDEKRLSHSQRLALVRAHHDAHADSFVVFVALKPKITKVKIPKDLGSYVFLENDRGVTVRSQSSYHGDTVFKARPETIEFRFPLGKNTANDLTTGNQVRLVLGGLGLAESDRVFEYRYPPLEFYMGVPEELVALLQEAGCWEKQQSPEQKRSAALRQLRQRRKDLHGELRKVEGKLVALKDGVESPSGNVRLPAPPAPAPKELRSLVDRYYMALHQKNIDELVAIIHPKALKKYRQGFDSVVGFTRAIESPEGLLGFFRVSSLDELAELPPKELFVRHLTALVETDYERFELMSLTAPRIEVLGAVGEGPVVHMPIRLTLAGGNDGWQMHESLSALQDGKSWRLTHMPDLEHLNRNTLHLASFSMKQIGQPKEADPFARLDRAREAYEARNYEECQKEYQATVTAFERRELSTWWYQTGCCAARAAKPDEAFDALERAVSLGYRDLRRIRTDSDLKDLHADERWKPLMDKLAEPAPKDAK